MKKQKHLVPDDEPEDKKPVGGTAEETPVEQHVDDEVHEQKLREIESVEVIPTESQEVSPDPDKEVVMKKPEPVLPWWKQRKIIIPAAIVLLIVIVLAVPMTRFAVLGWAWRENVAVTVTDSSNGSPVTDAVVSVAGKQVTTDNLGKATIGSVPLGYYTLRIEKQNYKTQDVSLAVDVFSSKQNRPQSLVATGRPVTISVVDRLNGKPVANAAVTDGGQAKFGRTDGDGHVTVVIPVNKKELDVSVAAGKYRVLTAKISAQTTNLQLIPDGSLYYLSKQSGKIDVVKSNLDGSDRKVVVAGTGDENDQTTTLLASRSWKYLVLKAKRAPNKPESLFVIDTATDTMKVLDEGATSFELIGWSGHHFMYKVNRPDNGQAWRAKLTAVKSYDADKNNLAILDENASDPGSSGGEALYETLGNFYILDDMLVYTKIWEHYGTISLSEQGKTNVIVSIKPDGSARKTVKAFDRTAWGTINARLYLPQEIYFEISSKDYQKHSYGEFDDGVYKDTQTINNFNEKSYPTFLMSPSGNSSFWYEERDGKNAIFIGDKNAGNKQEIVAKSEFKPYGWLTDDYLLIQKNDSELYITTKDQLKSGSQPLKVNDYHKIESSLRGYGYGYGGQ